MRKIFNVYLTQHYIQSHATFQAISFNYNLLNDLVSMLEKEISLEFVVLMLGYSSDNRPVIHHMLVVE